MIKNLLAKYLSVATMTNIIFYTYIIFNHLAYPSFDGVEYFWLLFFINIIFLVTLFLE